MYERVAHSYTIIQNLTLTACTHRSFLLRTRYSVVIFFLVKIESKEKGIYLPNRQKYRNSNRFCVNLVWNTMCKHWCSTSAQRVTHFDQHIYNSSYGIFMHRKKIKQKHSHRDTHTHTSKRKNEQHQHQPNKWLEQRSKGRV